MKKYRWQMTIFFLLAAGVCYGIQFLLGFGVFLVVGIIFEILFWVNVFKTQKNTDEKNV